MTREKENLIAADFAEQFAMESKTARGPNIGAICIALAEFHGTTPQEVDRIQREHATMGPN